MNFDRFKQLANTYGAEIERWPQGLQAQAHQWAATDTRARDVLVGAARLDALLRDALLPVSANAAAQLVDHTLDRISAPTSPRRTGWRLWPAVLLAGTVAAGCAAGRQRPQWVGLIETAPAASALASAFDVDGSSF